MEPFPSSLLLLLLLLFTLILPSATLFPSSKLAYAFCNNTGNFTAYSIYESNLRLLLRSLNSYAISSGFNTSTTGSPPNCLEGLALCRGDQSKDSCQACLDLATTNAESKCPHFESATIFQYKCHIRYSRRSFLNTIDNNILCLPNNHSVTSTNNARFNASIHTLLGGLRSFAIKNATSPRFFAAGEIKFDGNYSKIYGMVQCTRDISADQCDRCLDNIIKDIPRCYRQRRGGWAMTGTCSWRYEISEFFKWPQRLTIPALSSTPPTASPPVTTESNGTTSVDSGGEESSGNSSKQAKVRTIAISVGVSIFALSLIGCIYLYRRKGALGRIRSNNDEMMEETSSHDSLLFSIDSIKRATDNFSPSNKLGEGGFGPVYKGKLLDGREIAVKRLSQSSSQGVKELNNEILLQTRLQHRNLTRILGACVECGEKLLVYEFVANNSLDVYLSDHAKKLFLNWEVRRKIIAGIARGMLYLHEESRIKIIHRDIKASNILLDGEMNPKICDFGVARLFDENHTHACTRKVVGTFGYMPPEYVTGGKYSSKSDIYSFGVLILEVITGRKNGQSLKENSEDLFILQNYVWDHWQRNLATTIVDASMEGNFPRDEALRFIHIGLLCVQDNPKDRPTMAEVELMLGSESVVSIPTPQPPLFVSQTIFNVERSHVHSQNEVSISELVPR